MSSSSYYYQDNNTDRSDIRSQYHLHANYDNSNRSSSSSYTYRPDRESDSGFYSTPASVAAREGSSTRFTFIRHDNCHSQHGDSKSESAKKTGVLAFALTAPVVADISSTGQYLLSAVSVFVNTAAAAATTTNEVRVTVPGTSETFPIRSWYKQLVMRTSSQRLHFKHPHSGLLFEASMAHVFTHLVNACERVNVPTSRAIDLLMEGVLETNSSCEALQLLEMFRLLAIYNTNDHQSPIAVFFKSILPEIANHNNVTLYMVRRFMTAVSITSSSSSSNASGLSVCGIDNNLYPPLSTVVPTEKDVNLLCSALVLLLCKIYKFVESTPSFFRMLEEHLQAVKANTNNKPETTITTTRSAQSEEVWRIVSESIVQCAYMGTSTSV